MFTKKLLGLAITSVATVTFLLPVSSVAAPSDKSQGRGQGQERYIVKYKEGQAPGAMAALKKSGATVVKDLNRHDAMAITMPPGKVAALLKSDKIEYVEIDELRSPVPIIRDAAPSTDAAFEDEGTAPGQITPYGVSMVQAAGMTGNVESGIKVCVIDSGYDITHEDKPIGPFVDGTDDIGGAGPWDEDGDGHGTHVSGTINALDNDLGVIGVFPSSTMHVVRVFGDDGIWAYSSELVDALDVCMDNGAKIVSMSLGASKPTRLENEAFRKAEKDGVLSIAAAGNGADWSMPFDPMHYPAAYHSVMSVAAVDNNANLASFSQRNTDVEIAAPGVSVLSTVPSGSMYNVTLDVDTMGPYDVVPMDNFDIPAVPTGGALVDCGLAETAADCGGAPAGFTCLIERGEYTFAQKALSCQDAGGAAAVVYQRDGVDGPVYGTLVTTYVDIPVVGMDRASGLDLLQNALGLESLVNFALTGYDYDYYSGTSMATPHVSAVAQLVWSTHTNCSNMEIRNALNVTALDLGPSGQDHYFGNGLVQAQAASDYLDAHPCSGN